MSILSIEFSSRFDEASRPATTTPMLAPTINPIIKPIQKFIQIETGPSAFPTANPPACLNMVYLPNGHSRNKYKST